MICIIILRKKVDLSCHESLFALQIPYTHSTESFSALLDFEAIDPFSSCKEVNS